MVLNFPSNYKWFISETVSCLRSQWWSLLEFQALPPVAGFLSKIWFHLFLNLWFSSLVWNTTFGLTGFCWIKILCVIKDKKNHNRKILTSLKTLVKKCAKSVLLIEYWSLTSVLHTGVMKAKQKRNTSSEQSVPATQATGLNQQSDSHVSLNQKSTIDNSRAILNPSESVMLRWRKK